MNVVWSGDTFEMGTLPKVGCALLIIQVLIGKKGF